MSAHFVTIHDNNPSMLNIWYELSVGRYSPQLRNYITDVQERNFSRLFTEHVARDPTFQTNITQATHAAQVAVEQRSAETIARVTADDHVRRAITAQYTKELATVTEHKAKIAALENRCAALENGFGALFVGTLFGGLALLGYVHSKESGSNNGGSIIFG